MSSSATTTPPLPRRRAEAPVRSSYAYLDYARSAPNPRLTFAANSSGVATDQYRAVVKKLIASAGSSRRLLVTSPGPQDGKSTSAANLAWGLSDRGHSVLLLELDLRRPTLRTIFGPVPPVRGIEAVLQGEADPADTICRVRDTPLHLSTVAEPQSGAAKLLQGRRLEKLLLWGAARFEWLVLDAPPVFPVTDVMELTPHCDPVLLVVRARSTRATLARRAIESLSGSLSCVLFNHSDANIQSPYGYYGYGPSRHER